MTGVVINPMSKDLLRSIKVKMDSFKEAEAYAREFRMTFPRDRIETVIETERKVG